MNQIYAYNAGKGECIRLRYGDGHNIFIDTGVTRFADTLKCLCREIVDAGETLDLLILTHVDSGAAADGMEVSVSGSTDERGRQCRSG